jgi:hypothetical protein
MKERDQAENDLEAEWVEEKDTELCLNNALRNRLLAADDAPEKQGLDSLHLVCLCDN